MTDFGGVHAQSIFGERDFIGVDNIDALSAVAGAGVLLDFYVHTIVDADAIATIAFVHPTAGVGPHQVPADNDARAGSAAAIHQDAMCAIRRNSVAVRPTVPPKGDAISQHGNAGNGVRHRRHAISS